MTTATGTVTETLQTTLVELLDLSLQAKQAHWTVIGREFRPLHLQLDELTDEYRLWSDEVAERLMTLGTVPDGRASVLQTSSLPAFPLGTVDGPRVVELFTERLDAVIASLRGRISSTDEDPVSQDLLTTVLGGMEKQRWMVQVQGQ